MNLDGSEVITYWMSGGTLMIPLALTCFFMFYCLLNAWHAIHLLNQRLDAGHETQDTYRRNGRGIRNDFLLIAALAGAAPLLGLSGTVAGMLHTFDVLSRSGSALTAPLASGISEALITTQIGLVIAIPGLFGLSWLRRRLESMQEP